METNIIKGTEAWNLVMRQYPLSIELSKSRNKKYYQSGDRLPKYLLKGVDTGEYIWDFMDKSEKMYLWPAKDGKADKKAGRIYKNKKSAGTPNIKPISGQMFWESGQGMEFMRLKLQQQLYAYYAPHIVRHWPEQIWPPTQDHYIQFEYIFYTPFKEYMRHNQDIDNHSYPYIKVFIDTLHLLKVIPDDNPLYVRGYYTHYVQVATEEERRIEVKIHFCRNHEPITPLVKEYTDDNDGDDELDNQHRWGGNNDGE